TLAKVSKTNPGRGTNAPVCPYPDLKELRDSGGFADIAGVARHELTLTGAGDATQVRTVAVTPEIFSLLKVSPMAGRYLFAGDGIKGASPVVLLSEGLWQTRFGGDPNLVGGSIMLDQRAFTVVGIMPAGFQIPVFGANQEIWIPLVQDPLFSAFIPNRLIHGFFCIGRLNPGVSLAQAQAEADSIGERLAKEFPAENGGWSVHVAPLQEAIFQDVRTPLLVLLGAVGLVLLLACVNIAN